MSDFLKVLAWIYGAIGTIAAIAVAVICGKTVSTETVKSTVYGMADHVNTVNGRNWLITIMVFIAIMISVLITSAILSAVGDLLGRMDKVEYKINKIED